MPKFGIKATCKKLREDRYSVAKGVGLTETLSALGENPDSARTVGLAQTYSQYQGYNQQRFGLQYVGDLALQGLFADIRWTD